MGDCFTLCCLPFTVQPQFSLKILAPSFLLSPHFLVQYHLEAVGVRMYSQTMGTDAVLVPLFLHQRAHSFCACVITSSYSPSTCPLPYMMEGPPLVQLSSTVVSPTPVLLTRQLWWCGHLSFLSLPSNSLWRSPFSQDSSDHLCFGLHCWLLAQRGMQPRQYGKSRFHGYGQKSGLLGCSTDWDFP